MSGDTDTQKAPDDIDALLSDFEAADPVDDDPGEGEAMAADPRSADEPQIDPDEAAAAIGYYREQQHRDAVANNEALFGKAVAGIADRLDGADIGEKDLRARLLYEIQTDAATGEAWLNQNIEPDVWRGALNRFASGLGRETASRPDPDITADRESVAAAVRGMGAARTQDGDDIDRDEVLRLSPHKFEAWVKAQSGKSKR